MSAPPHDPVMGFAELAAELVGRAVAASVAAAPEPGSQDAEPAAKKVIIELSQTASAPGELILKVTDEGVALPQRLRAMCKALSPLERALASPAVRDGALLLRTTGATEIEVRRYQAMCSAGGGIDAVAAPPAPKPPGLRLSGTQATVTLDITIAPPAAAAEVCDQLLSMLRVLCPPVSLELKFEDLLLQPASQEGDSTADSTAPPQPPAPTSFTRLLEPLLLSSASSPSQRLKYGLMQEFQPSSVPAAADTGSPPLVPPAPPPPLSFVAVGEGPLPRGCKWGAAAGVVLQMPDHAALAAAAAAGGSPASPPAIAEEERERPPTAAWIFADHALQMSSNGTAAAALQRCNWAGHGFRLQTAAAAGAPPPMSGPLQLALRCEQPESGATIPLVVVRMYPLPRPENSAEPSAASLPPAPPPAPRHMALLIRGAVDAALAEMRQLCPSVIAGRRDRSLARALPVVAAAAAGILRRAVDGATAGQACAALGVGVGSHDLEVVLLQRLKEAVAAAEGAASQA